MASQDIYQALRAAQLEFPRIQKTRTAKVEMRGGGSYQYGYADLSDVIAAITPVLASHDLGVTQTFGTAVSPVDGKQQATLITRLQWSPLRGGTPEERKAETLSSEIPLPVGGNAQDLGSWITYLRRYALLAIVGLAAEDDDDGAATQPAPAPERPAQRSQGQAGGRVPPSSRASGQPAKPAESVPRGTHPADRIVLPPEWWAETVGWGKTTIRGKIVKDMTWMEMVDGAHVDGGRMGWMKSQVAYLAKTLEEGQYAGWARDKTPRLLGAIAHVQERGLRSKPTEPPPQDAA